MPRRNVNLNCDPFSIEGYFIKGLRAAGLTDDQIKTQIFVYNEEEKPKKNEKVQDLTDTALVNEWNFWRDKIDNSTHWGASIAAAEEFKKQCETEIRNRHILVPGYNT